MAEKRKDNKGRILKTGESQRKDFIYQYRYIDPLGKRQTVYASDLKELREKEKEIQEALAEGLNYSAGKITVLELFKRYIDLKQGVRYNTKVSYQTIYNMLEGDAFGRRQIDSIRTLDAKLWMKSLYEAGRSYKTVATIRGLIKPAFQLAVEDDAIRKNPFDFRLPDLIPNDTEQRVALTETQQKWWMDFIMSDDTFSKYYDMYVVLLETGVRVGELCGLTVHDVDFEQRRIKIDHQLMRDLHGNYFIERPKTSSGTRYIPMTDRVYASLQNLVQQRKQMKVETVVDGVGGFLFLSRYGTPMVGLHIIGIMKRARKKYAEVHPDKPLPHISAHVFRHTFCTNMANAKMDMKSLQYLMGHSNVAITMNVYTHASYDVAAGQLAEIYNFQPAANAD